MDSNVSYPVSLFLFFFFLYSLKVFLLSDCLVFYLWHFIVAVMRKSSTLR